MINARDAAATVARVSFRYRWNAVAPTITTARPSAASGVSHVAMLTAPGRTSPNDATTSAHVAIVRLTGMFCSEYLLQSGRREQMQHRMMRRTRGSARIFRGTPHKGKWSARLLVADHCGAGESTHFDVPHRRLTKEALVLAVELTRALIADFERRARGIDPFNDHSFSRGNQSKLFLVLKWAHRRQRAKMMMQG